MQQMQSNQVWGPQQIIIRSEDKQANLKAVKLQTDMLRLFFIVADCDWEDKKLTNARLPTLTTEMKNILNEPVSVCAIQLSNLFQTIFNEVPDNKIDQLNPLFSHMSMTHFDKKFATGILNARFQYTDLDGATAYESTEINIFHFGPQSDASLVNAARIRDANARNEIEFKIHESQRTKMNSTIEGIGRVNNIEDVVKVCANFCAVMRAIVDIEQGKPFLYSLMVKMILVIQHPDFQRWRTNNKKSLEHLHFNFMHKLHQVFTKLASFSSNSKNTHAIKHNVERPEFHLKDINSAIKLASTFFEKMQENIDNKTTTGLDLPAFANVLVTAPPLAAKRSQHPNVGDETNNHRNHQNYQLNQGNDQNFCNNQDFDGGNKRTKKERPPRTNLGLFHAKPGTNKDFSLGSKENPLATNSVCREKLAISSARSVSSLMLRAGRHLKRMTKRPSSCMQIRWVTSGLTRQPSKTRKWRFPRSISIF